MMCVITGMPSSGNLFTMLIEVSVATSIALTGSRLGKICSTREV